MEWWKDGIRICSSNTNYSGIPFIVPVESEGAIMNCWKCRTEIEIAASAKVLKTDSCPKCDYDLHVCLNCRFYDPSAHNQCRETQAEWVRDKEKANYCDYFEPRRLSGLSRKGGKAATDAKAAFDNLFKK